MELPSLDQNICGAWIQQEKDLYNKVPYYLKEGQASYRKHWTTWAKLGGKITWTPNQGETMRTVIAEPTPILRQSAYPVNLQTTPLTDVVATRERTLDSSPRWQDFVSPHFHFLPSFQDFLKHVKESSVNINKQITVFEDVFLRTNVFDQSPYVYIAGVGLVAAPTGEGNAAGTAAGSKNNAWWASILESLAGSQTGWLSFEELFKALNVAEVEVGMVPFEGSGMPGEDSSPLNERFCLVESSEAWNNFVNDPWLKENRPLNMNIVSGAYKGDLFGKIKCKLERYPLNVAVDANFAPTFHAPETIELNPAQRDFGRTKPNLSYAQAAASTVSVAFLVGGAAFEALELGPPPTDFTASVAEGDAIKMNWNGKAYMTKHFLIPCKDANGNTQYKMNDFGRYIRMQATANVGYRAMNPQNILPIVYKRRTGISTIT